MTNEEAILRLGCDMDDEAALIAFAENNLTVMKAMVRRYFNSRAMRKKAFLSLLVQISICAKEFVKSEESVDRWIAACVEMECKRLRSKTRLTLSLRNN